MNSEFKIVEYKTAAGSTVMELDLAVMELLGSGYEPFGSPYVSGPGDDDAQALAFYQAMVLTNKPRVTIREFANQETEPKEVSVTVTGDDFPAADVTR